MSESETVRVTPMRELIAEEIRVVLARRRLSASELARKIGATQPYISRRLTGDIAFDVDDLQKIAAVLNVEVVDLLPRSTEGRTLTTVGDPAGHQRAGINARSGRLGRPANPISHTKRTASDTASRRPARRALARH